VLDNIIGVNEEDKKKKNLQKSQKELSKLNALFGG